MIIFPLGFVSGLGVAFVLFLLFAVPQVWR